MIASDAKAIDSDHNDDGNMMTKIWGCGMWTALHSITFCYPKNPSDADRKTYKSFFELIGEVLPCDLCKKSYRQFIQDGLTKLDDKALYDRDSLTKWLYYVHEAINKKLGVNYGISYDDVVKKYESYRTDCVSKQKLLGCDIQSLDKKKIPFKNANNKECVVIPKQLAMHFIHYAKMRGLQDNDMLILFNDIDIHSDAWYRRNKECYNIINYMRENGIKSLETFEQWYGLPTTYELKLIMRQCSNLSIDKLNDIIKLLPDHKINSYKIYKLVS